MTLLQAILKLLGDSAGNIGNLKAILQSVVDKFPDLAAELGPVIAALDATVTPEAIAALAVSLPPELWHIVQGKLDPRDHSGDAV